MIDVGQKAASCWDSEFEQFVHGSSQVYSSGHLHFSAYLATADMKPFTESITRERQQLNSSMETLFPVMLSEWQQHFAVFVQVNTNLMLLVCHVGSFGLHRTMTAILMFRYVNSDSWPNAGFAVPQSSTDTLLFSYEACIKLLALLSLCMSPAMQSDTSTCAQSLI